MNYSDYEIQYAYVVPQAGRLGGAAPAGPALAPRQHRSSQTPTHRVEAVASSSPCTAFFDEHPFVGVPVTDAAATGRRGPAR